MVEQCMEMMRMMGSMGGMMGGNMMGGMMGPMFPWTLLVGVLLVIGIVLLISLLWPRMRSTTTAALSILQERYARGEIDREEYEERRGVLQSRP